MKKDAEKEGTNTNLIRLLIDNIINNNVWITYGKD
jgi:hypothetical protein